MLTIRISRRVAFLVILGVFLAIPAGSWASHRFTDVPDSNIFHDDITWLADAGVTKGCNPPVNDEFCPDDAVTREQMAAFLKRLAEARVVDADTLDGLDSAAFLGGDAMAYFAGGDQAEALTDVMRPPEVVRSVTFTPPSDGVAIVNSTLNAYDPDADNSLRCSITADSGLVDNAYAQKWASSGMERADGQVAGTRGFEVTGGEEVTVNLVCAVSLFTTPGSAMEVRDSALTVMLFPD